MNLKDKFKTYSSLFEKSDFSPKSLLHIRDNILFSYNYWQETNCFSSYQNIIGELGYLIDLDLDYLLGEEIPQDLSLNYALTQLVLSLTSPTPIDSRIIGNANIFFCLLIKALID